MLPFDAGYVSYVIMLVMGIATGMEGCFMEVAEMRANTYEAVGNLQPCVMMMLSDMATGLCHKVRDAAAQKPLGSTLMSKAVAMRSVESFQGNTATLPPTAGGCFANFCDRKTVSKLRRALGGRVSLVGAGAFISIDIVPSQHALRHGCTSL